ncbi:class I SAM-dependent methyltransferase [Jiella mangrovi]|uniref:Class I SAM-dependent methyltransferase n=1 Tax=Jiella mangrovi TaxID=2821407 RepID=A0ABS4BG96_9HYPH|nr:class I SAM-dependent methyltransferase [Jiella mangrovi]MBP0615778.1 class I SAM-dependent methyltransferase [Jiella mangrovi]
MTTSTYVLGHDPYEIRRLTIQSQVFAGGTERILRAAGLGAGHSVLDIGTGAGDVAMMAAELTGVTGDVLGIDQSPAIVDVARERAGRTRHPHLRFQAASLDSFSASASFDLVVGRYVLVHQQDPAAFVRQAAKFVRPGGAILFIEPNVAELTRPDEALRETWSNPPVTLYDETAKQVVLGFSLAGVALSCGGRLVDVFQAAGLSEPSLLCEMPMAGPQSDFAELMTLTLRSLLPALEHHAAELAADIEIETLHTRLRNALLATRSQLRFADLVGAWTTVTG